jgi:hypothetical protein
MVGTGSNRTKGVQNERPMEAACMSQTTIFG